MCGVVGLLLKDPGLEPELGAMLAPMIEALSDRGPDSSGIALYSRSAASREIIRAILRIRKCGFSYLRFSVLQKSFL